jgi:hypothetical protein
MIDGLIQAQQRPNNMILIFLPLTHESSMTKSAKN